MKPYCPVGADDDMIGKLILKHNGDPTKVSDAISEWHEGRNTFNIAHAVL